MITNLNLKITDLTVGELKNIIAEIIAETLEDILEEREASSSENYINSVSEAREEYKAGKFIKLDDFE